MLGFTAMGLYLRYTYCYWTDCSVPLYLVIAVAEHDDEYDEDEDNEEEEGDDDSNHRCQESLLELFYILLYCILCIVMNLEPQNKDNCVYTDKCVYR